MWHWIFGNGVGVWVAEGEYG